MRIFLLLGVGGALLTLLVLIERWRRRIEYWHGPWYRQQLADWAARDPQIKAAKVPKIAPLKGEKVIAWRELRRVK